MTTPVRQAREALGARLREIRKDANLTARALAVAVGWHFTKVSKLENGARNPTEDDIRVWCQACGAAGQIPDLIATVRHIEAMYLEYRRQMQSGIKHLQESSIPLYQRTQLFRVYETLVIPGLLTTAEYASEIFRFWTGFMAIPDDVDQAIAARMERQRVLYTGNRRFIFVIEEQVLRTRVGSSQIMRGQLDRLLAVLSLHRVSLGIIPRMAQRHSLAQGSFWIFDESRVHVETVAASLTITQPREVALYGRAFELLQESAVYGPAARQLITTAISDYTADDLPRQQPPTSLPPFQRPAYRHEGRHPLKTATRRKRLPCTSSRQTPDTETARQCSHPEPPRQTPRNRHGAEPSPPPPSRSARHASSSPASSAATRRANPPSPASPN